MAKTRFSQNSFVGGALDPTLFGRTDIASYFAAAAKLENMVVLPQGGVKRREGLRYVDTLPAAATRLVPFMFNDEQAYLLVFSQGQLDIYRNDEKVFTTTATPISSLTEDMLETMNWTQSNDVLLLVHADLPPLEIARLSDTNWQLNPINLKNIPPFAFGGITLSNPATTCTPDGVSGTITLTTAAAVWLPEHVGQYVNINDGRIFLTGIISSTVAKGQMRIELTDTNPAPSGAWSLETGYENVISQSRGWPRSVAFYQSRLVFGGLKSRPQTLLFSKVGDFFDFDVAESLASDGIDITIDDDRANVIRNIFPGRGLQIFTTGGEFLAAASSFGDGLTPENISLQRGTFHGSSRVRPESVDGATLFVEGNGRVIRSFLFSDVEQAFSTDDVTLLSAHLVRDIRRMGLRRSTAADGANFLYVVNADGSVAALNTLRSQNLRAWSRFTTMGQFRDVAVVGDEVYFAISRTLGGQDVRTLERLDNTLFTDSAITQTALLPETEWAGADHLHGQTVSLRGDGYVLGEAAIASGTFTSPEAVLAIEAGLGFASEVETLPLLPSFNQAALGERRRLVSVNVLVEKSDVFWVASGKTNTRTTFSQFGTNVLDALPQPQSGWLKIPLGGYSRSPQVRLTQDQPAPFHLLSLTIELGV